MSVVTDKASWAPAALHFAGADRPSHGTSDGLQYGGLLTFAMAKAWGKLGKFTLLTMVGILKYCFFGSVMESHYSNLRFNLLSKPAGLYNPQPYPNPNPNPNTLTVTLTLTLKTILARCASGLEPSSSTRNTAPAAPFTGRRLVYTFVES